MQHLRRLSAISASWRVVLGTAVLVVLGLSVWWSTRERPRRLAAAAGPRLVLLGLDGLDWPFLDSRIAQGRLPHFARLRREGLSGDLRTLRPILSPIIWTTIATGVGPDRHGVLDFLESDPSGKAVPITSHSRRERAFWELADGWGRSVGVVNWFGSWPAEPVAGWLVSDRLSYHSFFAADAEQKNPASLTWPPALLDEIQDLAVDAAALRDEDLAPYFGDSAGLVELARQDRLVARRLEQFRRLVAAARTYQAVALRLMERHPTDLSAIYLDSFDTAGHLFAPYLPPRREWIDARQFEHFAPTIDEVTEQLDGFLGELLGRLRPQDRLLVVSDHGFRTGADRLGGSSNIDEALATEWHRPEGVVALYGAGVAPGALDGMSVMDVLPSVCALLRVPPLTSFEGQVPPAIARLAPPLPAVPGGGPRALEPAAAGGGEDDEAVSDEIAERLEALGYVGSSPEAASAERFRANYYNNLGVYFQKTKHDYAAAEQALRKAMELDPDDPGGPANLASLLIAQRRFDEALALLDALIRRRPDLLNARVNRAICLRVVGRLDEAERDLEAILAEDPAFQPAWWNLALTREKAGKLLDAADAYSRAAALTIEPLERSATLNSAGLMWAQTGRLDAALEAFEDAVESNSAAIDPRINLANVHALAGRSEQARALFEEVLRREPDHVKALNGLGQLDLHAGAVQSARERLEHSLRLDPAQERIRQILGSLPPAAPVAPAQP